MLWSRTVDRCVTLGLIYDVQINEENVNIKMTLTTPACPFGPQLMYEIKEKVMEIKEVKNVNIDLVFEPSWKPTEEIKQMLGVE